MNRIVYLLVKNDYLSGTNYLQFCETIGEILFTRTLNQK